MRENRTKRLLADRKPALGVSLTIADPFVAELVGGAGLDFVMVDTEHAPISIDQLQMMLIALRTSVSTTLVRVAANDSTLVQQALDLGAEGVIVPDVTDGASCAVAVAAARYPTAGGRGFGPRRAARLDGGRAAYLAKADDEIAVIVMVEDIAALDHLDEILSTPGLDGILVGPADLAATMGHLTEPTHPDVGLAIQGILSTCRHHAFPFGIFAAAEPAARTWIERGASLVTVGADVQYLDQGLARTRTFAAELRKIAGPK